MAEEKEYLESVRRDNQEAAEAQEKKKRRRNVPKIKLNCYYTVTAFMATIKIAHLRPLLNYESGTKDARTTDNWLLLVGL